VTNRERRDGPHLRKGLGPGPVMTRKNLPDLSTGIKERNYAANRGTHEPKFRKPLRVAEGPVRSSPDGISRFSFELLGGGRGGGGGVGG